MYSVAINADRHFRIAFGQQFSVHAGLVLAQLIGPQPGIVLLHQSRVRMAASAKRRNLAALDLSAESRRFAHGLHVGLRRIAAVATRASQSLLRVYVLSELRLGHLQWRVEHAVAVQAGVGSLRAASRCERAQRQGQQHDTPKSAILQGSHKWSAPRCNRAQTPRLL